MKKLLLIACLFPLLSYTQSLIGGNNIIKTNVLGDAIGNYNITYERAFAKRFSFSLGVRYMPKTTMPGVVKDFVKKQFNDDNINLEDFQMGNYAITPEVRMYFGTGKMKGFYIAPYARYASFDLNVPVSYTYQTSPVTSAKASALFTGTFKSFSGGLLLGTQFQLATKLVLDVWIIGAHYGSSSGTIVTSNFNPPIDNAAKEKGFNDELANITSKEYGPFKFSSNGYDANTKTATIASTGAWAGVRALGLSLGLRF